MVEEVGVTLCPYTVLGVSHSASVADIRTAFKRLALRTHPDKYLVSLQGNTVLPLTQSTHPFHLVKEASEVLLDPLRRARYDQEKLQSYVRSVGSVSDVCSLDSFDLIEQRALQNAGNKDGDGLIMRVYALECRCGGVFEVILAGQDDEFQNLEQHCECDCCSLVICVTGRSA